MRRVVVVNHVTLDGVMQAPGHPDEDRRGGFDRGGWARPYGDEVMGRAMAAGMGTAEALLLGRRTFESFAALWPNAPDEDPFKAVMSGIRKHVASRTLAEPLGWENATLLPGDAAEAVAALKAEDGGDLVMLGSGDLIQSLLRAGLIDELLLTIHPLILGAGRRLFPDGGVTADLRLVSSEPTTTGVVMATYRPAA